MKYFILVAILSITSFAGSVRFGVKDVEGSIHAKNFIIEKLSSQLRCKLSDGSGGIEKTPTKNLRTKFNLDPSNKEKGNLYNVQFSKGDLVYANIFTKLQSCAYVVKVAGVRDNLNVSSSFVLAGSIFTMTDPELKNLLLDKDLNIKISNKLQPFNLIAQENGFICVEGSRTMGGKVCRE